MLGEALPRALFCSPIESIPRAVTMKGDRGRLRQQDSRIMNRALLIGTSGYSYPGPPPKGWVGAFYPEPKPKRFDELQYYSKIFSTVEINSTFYRPPSIANATAWAKKTPSGFTFSLKVWQKFTHPVKIGRAKTDEEWQPTTQDDVDQFRAGVEPIFEAGKIGGGFLPNSKSIYFPPQKKEGGGKK